MVCESETEIIGIMDGVCGDRPVIKGTRIEPRHLRYYALDNDVPGALEDYPGLTRDQVLAAFRYLER